MKMQAKKSRKYCGVTLCSKNSVRNPELTFFTLPSNPTRLELWLKNIQRDKPSNKRNIFVCETHFEDHYINLTDTRKRLTSYAIPTLNLPNGEITENGISKYCQTDAENENTTLYVSQKEGVTNIFVWNQPTGTRKTESQVSDLPHEGFSCNLCEGSITKYRYACLQCTDFDICPDCERNGRHSEHFVLRIPAARPYAEIHELLEVLRVQITSFTKKMDNVCQPENRSHRPFDNVPSTEQVKAIEEPEIEVKFEPTLTLDPFLDETLIEIDTTQIKNEPNDVIATDETETQARRQTTGHFPICSISIEPTGANNEDGTDLKRRMNADLSEDVKRIKPSSQTVNVLPGKHKGDIIITEIVPKDCIGKEIAPSYLVIQHEGWDTEEPSELSRNKTCTNI